MGLVGEGVGCVALRCVWRDVGGCLRVCWVPSVGLVCVGVTHTVGGHCGRVMWCGENVVENGQGVEC